jgi:hypothetical protein
MRGVKNVKRPGSSGTVEKRASAAVLSGASSASTGTTSSLKRMRICAPS